LKTVKERLEKLKLIASTRTVSRAASAWAVYKTEEDPPGLFERLDLLGKISALTGKLSDVVLHSPGDIRSKEEAAPVLEALKKNKLNPVTVMADLHIPWKRGVLNHRLMYGTLTSPYPEIRVASINQAISTMQIMRDIKCRQLGIWIPDGIDSPGEKNTVEMLDGILKGLRQIGMKIRKSENMLLGFRPIGPSYCAAAVPDWGTAAWLCRETDQSCRVIMDTAALLPGESVESVTISLLHQKMLGRVRISDNKLGMGNMPSGSLDSGALFRFFLNILFAEAAGLCSLEDMGIELYVESRVGSPEKNLLAAVENTMHALARASVVNPDELREAQSKPDPTEANRILRDAFATDVRPVVESWRKDSGLPEDPFSEI
jgi:L-rhamnose isomerase / sugar isomerase